METEITNQPFFQKSFGLSEGTIISAPLRKGYDVRTDIAKADKFFGEKASFKDAYVNVKKALTTTLNTYSAGTLPVLIPVYVDAEIIDETRRDTPLVELIPRVKNQGINASYNVITTITTAQALGENAAIAVQDDTIARRTVNIKYLYSSGSVTGPMWVASQPYLSTAGYVDALALEVKNKTLAGKRLEESMLLLGDSQANWTEPVNSTVVSGANSFDGLYNIITNANSCGLGGSSSYGIDAAAASLSIALMRQGVRDPATRGGNINLIVCDYRTYDDLKALIQDQLRYVNTMSIAWGMTTIEFEGVPVIKSRFLSTTAGTGSGTPKDAKSVFFLDTNVIEMRVLLDWTYQEKGVTNDSLQFWVKCYEALIVRAPAFNAVLFDLG